MTVVILQAIFIFVGIFFTDFLNALYVAAVAKNKKFSAATLSFVVVLVTGLIVIEYTKNPWFIIPAAIGAFFGTLASGYVRINKPKEKDSKESENS